MRKRAYAAALSIFLTFLVFAFHFSIRPVMAEYKVWTVDDDGTGNFETIQAAINAAAEGDNIYVKAGTYYESVVINKTVSLIGENVYSTIIDANGTLSVLYLISSNNLITGLTLRNCRSALVDMNFSSNNNLVNNRLDSDHAEICLRMRNSSNNTLSGNVIWALDHVGKGMYLRDSLGNRVFDNTFEGFGLGFSIVNSTGNVFFHNNFIDSRASNLEELANITKQGTITGWWNETNTWDDGYPSGGNYWSDYDGVDSNRDGIGDTPYVIGVNNSDNYPFMRSLGVKPGDWVKYGCFSFIWNSTDPNTSPPLEYDWWNNVEWTKSLVTAVSGPNITYEFSTRFTNGLEMGGTFSIDTNTGVGSLPFYFVSANLTNGDDIYGASSLGLGINETKSKGYLGVVRKTNFLNVTRFYDEFLGLRNYSESYCHYFDMATGVMIQQSYQRSFWDSTGSYFTYGLMSFRIVDTNLWNRAPVTVSLDLSPSPLNLVGGYRPLTAYVELPQGFEMSDVNFSSVTLNGTIPLEPSVQVTFNDYDNDGTLEIMLIFSRTAASEFLLSSGIRFGDVSFAIVGHLEDGTPLKGVDVVGVRMLGDANCDGQVDARDTFIVARAFGESPGGSMWNPLADQTEDDRVDLRDYYIVCINYGKSYL